MTGAGGVVALWATGWTGRGNRGKAGIGFFEWGSNFW